METLSIELPASEKELLKELKENRKHFIHFLTVLPGTSHNPCNTNSTAKSSQKHKTRKQQKKTPPPPTAPHLSGHSQVIPMRMLMEPSW